MKKTLSILLALLLVLGMFAGCGAEQAKEPTIQAVSEPAQSQNTPAEEVTVEFWTISLQPTFTDFFNGLFEKYEAENPGVKIKWVDLPYDAVQEKLVTAIASGNAPDVVNLNTEFSLNLAAQGALVDLNQEATEEQRSIYIETLYNSSKLGDGVYAFPWYGSPNILIVNTALFEQAGLTEYPTQFTSDETFDMARQMMDKTGAYLYDPYVLLSMMQYDGFSVLNEDKTASAFNTPEFVAYIEKLQGAVEEGIIPADVWGLWDEELRLFETGKLAVLSSSGSSLGRIKDEAPDIYEHLAIAAPMTGSLNIGSNPLMNVVVPTASKNHTEAIKFANFITNDESQLAFCKEVAIFPSTIAACNDPYFTSDTTTLEGQARAMCAQVSLTCGDWSLGVGQGSDITKIFENLEDAAFSDGDNAAEAVANAAAQVDKVMAG